MAKNRTIVESYQYTYIIECDPTLPGLATDLHNGKHQEKTGHLKETSSTGDSICGRFYWAYTSSL